MTAKRKPFTWETAERIIRRDGLFDINPLRYSSYNKMAVLKRMCKKGVLKRTIISCDRHIYTMRAKS